jgi:Uma2 family endonuclease
MSSLQLDLNKRYSYADYLTWLDDLRRELIDGFIQMMTPAPRRVHQKLSFRIGYLFGTYLQKKKCEIYHAPFDVRLPKGKNKSNKEIYTVVQPDICIICDPEKLDDKGCVGAPDLIVEIVSPRKAKYDVQVKFKVYEEHGVREYWIVQPNDQTVTVFLLDDKGKYQLKGIFADDDKIPVHIFNGDLLIDLTEVFDIQE